MARTKERTTEQRDAYLRGLSEDMGVPMFVVTSLAEILGPDEDYDGLVTALEDWEDEYGC